jgi:hypothetical protein
MSLRLPRSGVDRAIFSTATLGLGVVAVITAQAWATPMIAADSHLLTLWDFIVTFRFWALVMKRLPRSRYPLCLLSWGLAAIVGAVLIVGGLWYWLPGKKRVNFYLQNPEVQRTPQDDTGPPQDEIIAEKSVLAKPQGPTADVDDDDDPSAPAKGQKPTSLQCVVLGYIPDEEGRLVGLVLGAGEKGVYRYVGVVRRGINRANEEALRARLSKYIRLKPSIPDSGVSAIWVDPRVSCEVTQRGVGSASVLPNPFFKGLIQDPKEKKGNSRSTPAPAAPQ